MNTCEYVYFGICLTRPPQEAPSIFGFSEFLTALALLALAFSVSDFRYRFRLQVTQRNLRLIFFYGTLAIGLGTIATALWFATGIPAPALGVQRSVIDSVFALGFLALIFIWLWQGYVRPTKFGPHNAERYAQAISSSIIAKANHLDLADEILRSVSEIVCYAKQIEKPTKESIQVQNAARKILLTIAYPDFNRTIASQNPMLAFALIEEVKIQSAYQIPIYQFVKNFTTESILDTKSFLYSESLGFESGMFGYQKPLTSLFFEDGNFAIVDDFRASYPLDIHYKVLWQLDREQFGIYCDLCEAALKSLVKKGRPGSPPHWVAIVLENLLRPFDSIEELRVNGPTGSEVKWKIWEAMRVIRNVVQEMGKTETYNQLPISSRPPEKYSDNLLGQLSNTIFEACWRSVVSGLDNWAAWDLQHNTIWGVLRYANNPVGRKIHRRVSRQLYDEIRQMEKWPNFQSARALGFCLHVLGLGFFDKKDFPRRDYPLRVCSQKWAAYHFAEIWRTHRRVSEAVLTGGLTYLPDESAFIKEYSRGISDVPQTRSLFCCPHQAADKTRE